MPLFKNFHVVFHLKLITAVSLVYFVTISSTSVQQVISLPIGLLETRGHLFVRISRYDDSVGSSSAMQTLTTPKLHACLVQCSKLALCQGFSYNTDASQCWLLDAGALRCGDEVRNPSVGTVTYTIPGFQIKTTSKLLKFKNYLYNAKFFIYFHIVDP